MHVYVSIGPGCSIKHQLDIHKGLKETLFFDWIITCMESVISVLNHYDHMDDILNPKSIVWDPRFGVSDHDYSAILITSLPNCLSVHDVSLELVMMISINLLKNTKEDQVE